MSPIAITVLVFLAIDVITNFLKEFIGNAVLRSFVMGLTTGLTVGSSTVALIYFLTTQGSP